MKTTIDIADPLLKEARRVAARDGVTLRTLVERGLRQVLSESGGSGAPFRLRKASFRGRGLQASMPDDDWRRVVELAYEGRGS
jgi:hypothetical protein